MRQAAKLAHRALARLTDDEFAELMHANHACTHHDVSELLTRLQTAADTIADAHEHHDACPAYTAIERADVAMIEARQTLGELTRRTRTADDQP